MIAKTRFARTGRQWTRAVEREVRRQYGVRVVHGVETIRERFYAISAERRIRNPLVQAISSAEQRELLA